MQADSGGDAGIVADVCTTDGSGVGSTPIPDAATEAGTGTVGAGIVVEPVNGPGTVLDSELKNTGKLFYTPHPPTSKTTPPITSVSGASLEKIHDA